MSARTASLVAALLACMLLLLSMVPAVDAARGGSPGRPSPKPTATPGPTPTPTRLEGIDVSVYQNTIDWAKVKAAGKGFAIIRASAGSLTDDTQYEANRAGAAANGIPHAAYHFANPDVTATKTVTQDATLEADWFLQNATPASGDMIPALDVEKTNGLSVSQMKTWVSTWLQRVASVTGVKPMIYTSPNFWSTYLGNTTDFAVAGYKVLWIAHWGVSQPTVPASNWGGYGWTFWQYTSSGTVNGISGNVDLDRYNGLTLDPSLFIP
jgi:GH25 family lysozyme M1 (1,4-beta-N-acetylmuramidase)